jgi:putative transposase
VRYQFVEQHRECFSLVALCRVMKVTRSGFYAWKKQRLGEPSLRHRENEALLIRIRQFFEQSDQTYGSPRILRDLKDAGFSCGRHRVARIMRKASLRAVVAPRFQVTTDSKHSLPIAENLLDRDFGASEPNVKWAGDITYIWTREGWLYLAVVLDLFSRRVVGWSMQPTLERSIVLNALQAALCHRQREAGTEIVYHSDRGSQYASGDFQQLLAEQDISCSMSRKGNPGESGFRCVGTMRL